MRDITLYFESEIGAERANSKLAAASRGYCPVAEATVGGKALFIHFPDTAKEDQNLLTFCFLLKDPDHRVIRCDVLGFSDYAKEKIQGAFMG